jgi:hypothetical protein
MEDLKCFVIDSSMTIWTLKQEKMQKIFDNLSPLEIISQVDNEDIVELIIEIICNFKKDNVYDLDYIINELQDIKLEKEVL